MKKCNKCKINKEVISFQSYFSSERNIVRTKSICKDCEKIERLKNRDKISAYIKKYNKLNKNKVRKKQYEWRNNKYKTDETYRTKIIKESSIRRTLKKEEINKKKYQDKKKKLRNDPIYKMTERIRCRIYIALKNKYQKKNAKTFDYIGCTYQELRIYIEGKFLNGMTWDNYGKVWDIDHIFPISKVDLTKEEDRLFVFNYKNLQPLWSYENRFIKRNLLLSIERE